MLLLLPVLLLLLLAAMLRAGGGARRGWEGPPRPAHLGAPPPPPGQGNAKYVPEKEALMWSIKNFPGGREFLLRCKFGLPSVAAEEEGHGRMPPIKVKFEVSALAPGRAAALAGGARTWSADAGQPCPPPPCCRRSRTSRSAASRSGTSRWWRSRPTRPCLGCGTSRKPATTKSG